MQPSTGAGIVDKTSELATANRLIDALGGATKLARAITERAPEVALTPQAVSRWRKMGIAHRCRGIVAAIARERSVAVPYGFTTLGAASE